MLSAIGYEAAALSAGGLQIGPDGAPQVVAGARAAFQMAFYPIFFTMVGILSGLLGRRLQQSEQALADAADEMDKLRLDTESIIQNLSSALLTIDRAGRIVTVLENAHGRRRSPTSPANYRDWTASRSLEAMTAAHPWSPTFTGRERADRWVGLKATPELSSAPLHWLGFSIGAALVGLARGGLTFPGRGVLAW